MKRLISIILNFLLIMCFGLSVVSCTSEEDTSGSLPSVDDPVDDDPVDDEPIDDVPIGEVEPTGFWVNLITDDQFAAYVKKRDQWGDNCFIDAETTTQEYIECVIDVMELDLYLYDMNIQYNAPPGMCDHIRIRPAWFWNYSSGIGPSTVEIDLDVSVDPTVMTSCMAEAEPALEFAVDGINDDGLIACSSHPELVLSTDGLDYTCIYDHSATNADLPNCCFGNVTYTVNSDDGATTETEVQNTMWGDDISNCISPQLSTSWNAFFDDYPQVPVGKFFKVPKDPVSQNPVGLNGVLSLNANVTNLQTFFSTWSNWYEEPGVANGHTHDGFWSATTSNEPYAVDPVDDLSGSPYDGTNGLFPGRGEWSIECLDAAEEVRHRIDIYIREWNTLADFVAYGTSEGVTYDPDVSGNEGAGCNYDPIFNYDGCNDQYDFTEVLNHVSYGAGGAYGTTPGVDSAADREHYFPRIPQ